MSPSAPILQCLRPQCLFSRFPPRATHSQGIYLVRLSCRTDAVAQVFTRNRVIFNHCSKKYYWSFKWFSESPLIRCLPIRQEILNISQIAAAFHGIRPPTISHPDQIATVPQMSLPQFCVPFAQQFHLFPIGEVLTYNDSRIGLHRICQILGNCLCL